MDTSVKIYKALIWLSLYGAALHFFDNVYFFNQYPEPAWLNAPIVALLFIPIALLAHRAVDLIYRDQVEYSYSLVHALVFSHWLSLGHYLFANPVDVLPRINLAIGIQVSIAGVLFVYTLWLQNHRSPESLRYARRAWLKNLVGSQILVLVLELIWPSNFSTWWMWWVA